jgi:hypothetical protein
MTHSQDKSEMKPHWVSIYVPADLYPAFEYHGPWWVTGATVGEDEATSAHTVCAWVMATDPEAAVETLRLAFDEDTRPATVEERFSDEKPMPDRSNPSGRFEFDDWMQWPWPILGVEVGS